MTSHNKAAILIRLCNQNDLYLVRTNGCSPKSGCIPYTPTIGIHLFNHRSNKKWQARRPAHHKEVLRLNRVKNELRRFHKRHGQTLQVLEATWCWP